jgi:hypothetical protein
LMSRAGSLDVPYQKRERLRIYHRL